MDEVIQLSDNISVAVSQVICVGWFTGYFGLVKNKDPAIRLVPTNTIFGRDDMYFLTDDHYKALYEKLKDSFIEMKDSNILINPLHIKQISKCHKYFCFGDIYPYIYLTGEFWQRISFSDYERLRKRKSN